MLISFQENLLDWGRQASMLCYSLQGTVGASCCWYRTEAKREQHLWFSTVSRKRLTKLSRHALKPQVHQDGRAGYRLGKKAQSVFLNRLQMSTEHSHVNISVLMNRKLTTFYTPNLGPSNLTFSFCSLGRIAFSWFSQRDRIKLWN